MAHLFLFLVYRLFVWDGALADGPWTDINVAAEETAPARALDDGTPMPPWPK